MLANNGWRQTIVACCKQLSLIAELLVLEPENSVLSVSRSGQFNCLPFLLWAMQACHALMHSTI